MSRPWRRFGQVHQALWALVAAAAGLTAGGCSDSGGSSPAAPAPLPPPTITLDRVACLATQWYPQVAQNQDEAENRLLREIVRQGVLIAARDELGLVTRDETLGEPFPQAGASDAADVEKQPPAEKPPAEPKPIEPLMVALEVNNHGDWSARLYGAGSEFGNPVWRHAAKIKFNKRTVYAEFAKQIVAICPTIAAQLRRAGAKGAAAAAPLNPQNTPPAEVEQQLGEMNFVSQYAAVRAAHQAMADKGPSIAWLSVLVRGYAHLALLTAHHWSSQHEAFAARSLLYAERMIEADQGSALALWHRAYSRAIIGAHGAALSPLKELDELAKSTDKPAAPATDPPAWTRLIEPFVAFDHEALQQVARDHAELEEIVALLDWEHYRSHMHGRWIYERGVETMRACPEAYGVYSVLANWPALMIERMGSAAGTETFGSRLPIRVAELKDLPKAARAFAGPQSSLLSRLFNSRSQASLSDRPIKLSRALAAATRDEATPSECSWAILAGLIAEEQFVEAANVLEVSGNAVEHSKAELVEQLAPLVADHRYAAFIQSFANSPAETARTAEMMSTMTVVDPRVNMRRMLERMWRAPDANGKTGNELTWRAVWARNFTLPGMIESYSMAAEWSAIDAPMRQRLAGDFRQVSPNSPSALRLRWETADAVTAEQLPKWEAQLKDDPVGWLTLGYAYAGLPDAAGATRCYQRSLDISPSYDATVSLANAHYANDKKDLWQATLETYLKLEDLSLSHAQVHQLIATEHLNNRRWKKAEPHSLEAAQTYSAWGLQLASRTYEGLEDWEKSEYFSAEATRNYPSHSSGTDWYFWCRRTGRGDAEAAREFAEKSIAIAAAQNYQNEAQRVFVYRLLEGEAEQGLAAFAEQRARCPEQEGLWDKAWRLLHTIAIAGELKDAAGKQAAIDELRALASSEIKASDPEWEAVATGLCDVFAGEAPDAAFLAQYDKTTDASSPQGRCNYRYFMGVALDQLGRTEEADRYMRRAAFGGPFDSFNATLAGDRLVKRHGVERGGLPEEFAAVDAEQAEETEDSKGEGDGTPAEDSAETDPSI